MWPSVKDGFQWHDHGEVSPWPVDKCPWEGIGTGDVWRYTGRDGKKKYVINYSRWPSNAFPDGQRAYFATSDDLIHWTPEYPYTPNCTEKGVFGTTCAGGVAAPYSNGSIPFIIDQRYYEYHGWDTLTGFPLDEADHSKGIVGFWNAAPNKAHSSGSMSWGFGSAADGLHWTAHPPPRCGGKGANCTGCVSGCERFSKASGRIYCTCAGRSVWTATSPAGPFTLQTRNAQTNGGEDWDRFFRLNYDDVDAGIMVTYGTLSNQISEPPGDPVVYFPIYKVAKPDPRDNITLYYWYWNVSRHMT